MATIRRNDLLTSIALGCTLPFATQAFGQAISSPVPLNRIENAQTVTVTVQAAPRQHLGNGPIDMNNLPPDILNCDVCRQRLGLPPLNSASNPISNTPPSVVNSSANTAKVLPQPNSASLGDPLKPLQTGRMLGSPGMITSATAEQLALNGMVVEEFKPPQPNQNAIQLGALPPEVRQDFLRGLGLPPGARIMSAEIKGKTGVVGHLADDKTEAPAKSETLTTPATLPKPNAASSQSSKTGTLGGAGIVSQPEATSVAPAETISSEVAQKSATATPETIAPASPLIAPSPVQASVDFAIERNELQQTIEKLQKQLEEQASAFAAKSNQQMELLQSESKKRLEQSEASSREVLTMLEKRTAEVTELQIQFKAQQDEFVKAQQELAVAKEALAKSSTTEKRSASDKRDGKKKQNKDKKPAKPTEVQ